MLSVISDAIMNKFRSSDAIWHDGDISAENITFPTLGREIFGSDTSTYNGLYR